MIDKKNLTFEARRGPTAVGAARAGVSRINCAYLVVFVFGSIRVCFLILLRNQKQNNNIRELNQLDHA